MKRFLTIPVPPPTIVPHGLPETGRHQLPGHDAARVDRGRPVLRLLAGQVAGDGSLAADDHDPAGGRLGPDQPDPGDIQVQR